MGLSSGAHAVILLTASKIGFSESGVLSRGWSTAL